MKRYNIYYNSSLERREAVKIGWSWPAFFFSWIWCFVKGLVGQGFLVIAIAFFSGAVSANSPETLVAFDFVPLLVSIFLGSQGNLIREKKLISRGYLLENESFESYSPTEAIIAFQKNKKESVQTESIQDNESKDSSSVSDLELIEKLYELKEKGAITDQEFEKKKKEILNLN